jgi:hypothetical protein
MRLSRRIVPSSAPLPIVLSIAVIAALSTASSSAVAQQTGSDSIRVLNQARAIIRDHMDSQRLRSSQAARDARARAIDRLDELALSIPGDDWIVGHRVGLRVVQGYLESALAVARECRASAWWCDALTGFVLHLSGDFEAAEQAFDRSMAAMEPAARCEWIEDLRRHLVSGAADRAFRAADCARSLELTDRYWWLGDPFYLLPGNDRKSEHFARVVGMELHHQYLHFDGRPCSPGHHAAQVLQGWPEWWWETEGPITELGPGAGYSFLPGSEVWEDPLRAPSSAWSLSAGGFDERYDPQYGPIYELDSQVAFFARGEGVTVVAASDLTRLPLNGATIRDAGLVLALDERTPPLVDRGEVAEDRLRFRLTAPDRRYLVSLEVLAEGNGAARSRAGYGLSEPEDGPSLSDLLLWEWRENVTQELDSIAPLMLGTTRVPLSDRLGIYWETYGLAAGDVVDVSMQALPRGGGMLRRLGEALRLVGPRESLRFVWREGADTDETGIVGRTLELDLSGLGAGEYTIELGIVDGAGRRAVSRREIVLRDD